MTGIPSTEDKFIATLQECLQTDNEKRTAAEVRSVSFSSKRNFRCFDQWNRCFASLLVSTFRRFIKKSRMNRRPFFWCQLYAIQAWQRRFVFVGWFHSTNSNSLFSFQLRGFAAVLLRRLFQTEFENFWPKYSPDQQLALRKELLGRIALLEEDENIRKKICYIVAELAKNLMGYLIAIRPSLPNNEAVRSISLAFQMTMTKHNGPKFWSFSFIRPTLHKLFWKKLHWSFSSESFLSLFDWAISTVDLRVWFRWQQSVSRNIWKSSRTIHTNHSSNLCQLFEWPRH